MNDLESLLVLGGGHWSVQRTDHPALHPGQSAEIIKDNQIVGYAGALHPEHQRALDVSRTVWLFELLIAPILREYVPKYRELSRYPSVRRDLAVVVEEDVPARQVLDCVGASVSDVLNKLELFDVYQGEGIDSGKKSLAIGLTFQKSSSTLTDTEVDALVDRAVSALRDTFRAELRE